MKACKVLYFDFILAWLLLANEYNNPVLEEISTIMHTEFVTVVNVIASLGIF